MLAQALNSSRQITCFRELFNSTVDFIDFSVDGYDNFSAEDRALRDGDQQSFLRTRIFCEWPQEIRAVGFKMPYTHFFGFEGLQELLIGDQELRVLHLQRRNMLRTLVSLKIAKETGIWLEEDRRKFTTANAISALRHPLQAARRIPGLLPHAKAAVVRPPKRAHISPAELYKHIIRMELSSAKIDDLFRDHPMHTVLYEDLQRDREAVFDQTQSFLGVEQRPLTVTLRRQNPQPLRDLLENYDELYEAFGPGDHRWMFADG